MDSPDAALWDYLEKSILPRYADFDPAHSAGHIRDVLQNSLEIAKDYPVSGNMVITVAAYHDLGLDRGRANHHITSGEILMRDPALRNWFTEDELATMREAVEDHRASGGREPRSIYGRIVSEADRIVDPETVISRTMNYGKAHCPELSPEEQLDRAEQHLREKYGESGYLKLWLETERNARGLRELRELLTHREALRARCARYL